MLTGQVTTTIIIIIIIIIKFKVKEIKSKLVTPRKDWQTRLHILPYSSFAIQF